MEFKVSLDVEGPKAAPIAIWCLTSKHVQINIAVLISTEGGIIHGDFNLANIEKINLRDYENIDFKYLYEKLIIDILPKLERKFYGAVGGFEVPETLEIDLSDYQKGVNNETN